MQYNFPSYAKNSQNTSLDSYIFAPRLFLGRPCPWEEITVMHKLALAAAAAVAAFGLAGTASAGTATHFFVFKNNSTETFTRTSQSNGGWSWGTTQPATAAAGATESGEFDTPDFTAIAYSDTWTSSVDGTACTFSIYSAVNRFTNLQFYESTAASGPRASTIKCTITAPPQPYSTNRGNVEMDYNVSF